MYTKHANATPQNMTVSCKEARFDPEYISFVIQHVSLYLYKLVTQNMLGILKGK